MLESTKQGQNVHSIISHALKAAVEELKTRVHFDALHFADWIRTAGGPITFAKAPAQTPMLVVLTDLNGLADASDEGVRCIDPEACGMIYVGGDHFATTVTSATCKHAVTLAIADLGEDLREDIIEEHGTIFAEIIRKATVVKHLDLTPVYLQEVLRVKVGFAVQVIVNAYKTGKLPQDRFYHELARKLIIEPGSLRAHWEADKLVIKTDPRRMTTGVSHELVKHGIDPERLAEDYGFHRGDDLVCMSTPFDPSLLAELAIDQLRRADIDLGDFDGAMLKDHLLGTRSDRELIKPDGAARPPVSGGKAGPIAEDAHARMAPCTFAR